MSGLRTASGITLMDEIRNEKVDERFEMAEEAVRVNCGVMK